MIAFFRQLCAAPFKILFFLLRIFQNTNPALIRLIWRIGGESDYANMLVSALGTKDLVAARKEAKTLLEKTHNAQIASTMAIYELYLARNAKAAHQWIKEAEALHCEHEEHLLFAKLCLGDRVEEYDAETIAKEIISRNDLPMQYSSRAYVELAEHYIEHKRWNEADEILDRILAIEANPGAFGLKWIVELYRKNSEAANSYLAQYKKVIPAPHAAVFEAAGYYCLNDISQAKVCLRKAINDYGVTRDYICFVKKELNALLDGDSVGAES